MKTKTKIHIFVGDCDDSVARAAKCHDPNAFLIDRSVYQKFKKSQLGNEFVAYTSLADLPKITESESALWHILNAADRITYHPPKVWSDHTATFDHWSAQRMTEYLLSEIQRNKHNVSGLDLAKWVSTEWLPVVAGREHDGNQLWISGCSVSHGIGVQPEERYGHLLGQRLAKPVSWLTQPGSSVSWAADQLLRADIRLSDTVVWGITSEYRHSNLINDQLVHRPVWTREASDNRSLADTENFYYLAITALHQVRNHCKMIGARLILLPILCSENIKLRLLHCEEYCPVPYAETWLDIGDDGHHPGPVQHRTYADLVCAFLEHNHA